MTFRLLRKTDQAMLASRVEVADSFVSRTRGLIGRKSLPPGDALLLPRCSSIHMWFMSISIDVIFLQRTGSEWKVLKLCPSLRPWKLMPEGAWGADDALEVPEGSIRQWNLRVGEVLCIAS